MTSLQTYLIDGDKGGVGKSLTTRALAHYFLSMDADARPVIAVFDADMSNPDVCGKDGRRGMGLLIGYLAQELDIALAVAESAIAAMWKHIPSDGQ